MAFDIGATIGAALIGPMTAIIPVNRLFLASGGLLFIGVLVASYARTVSPNW